MSIKKYWGMVLAIVPIVLILVAVTIILNTKNNVAEGDYTNIAELPQEFLDSYFENYTKLQEVYDPENILMVTSKTRPATYGATRVVEAPNYLYFLQYDNVEVREEAYANLERDGAIVERNQIYNVMGDDDYLSWGIEDMELNNLIGKVEQLKDPNEVVVAVIDTGMDVEVFTDYFDEDRLLTYCVVECDDGMDDRHEATHGTHVGGTVAEATADNVKVLAIKVTNDEEGAMYLSDVVTAINYAISANVDVINMSLGGTATLQSMENACEAAAELGIVNVAAAGNENVRTPNYPASYDSVISVSAVSDDWEKWEYSNYGDYIDFTAPGDLILGINDYYMSGTSMASPHIAAAVASLKSFNNEIDLDDTKTILKEYAIDLGDEGWDEYYGWGLVSFDEIGLCSEDDCDDYGIFDSPWIVAEDNTDADYILRTSSITVISERACMVIAEYDDYFDEEEPVYTKVAGTKNGDDTYVFDLTNIPHNNMLILGYVGDVTMDGTVNVLDLSKIKRSILLPTSKNYQALSELAEIFADVTKDGKVNVLDLSKIKRSILLPTSRNYAPLSW